MGTTERQSRFRTTRFGNVRAECGWLVYLADMSTKVGSQTSMSGG